MQQIAYRDPSDLTACVGFRCLLLRPVTAGVYPTGVPIGIFSWPGGLHALREGKHLRVSLINYGLPVELILLKFCQCSSAVCMICLSALL